MSARERYQPGWWERWERCLLVRGWLAGSAGGALGVGGWVGWEPGRPAGEGAVASERWLVGALQGALARER